MRQATIQELDRWAAIDYYGADFVMDREKRFDEARAVLKNIGRPTSSEDEAAIQIAKDNQKDFKIIMGLRLRLKKAQERESLKKKIEYMKSFIAKHDFEPK